MNCIQVKAQNVPADYWYLIDLDNEVGDDDIEVDEYYLEHTQVKPNRYDLFVKEVDSSIENSYLIIDTNDPTVKPNIKARRDYKLNSLI
jgi:hypothetical protein